MFVCHFSGLKRAAWLRTCVRIVLVFLSHLTLERSLRYPSTTDFTSSFIRDFYYWPLPVLRFHENPSMQVISFTTVRRFLVVIPWMYHRFVDDKNRLFIAALSLSFDRSEFVRIFVNNKIHSVECSSGDCAFQWAIFDIYFFLLLSMDIFINDIIISLDCKIEGSIHYIDKIY